MTDDPTGPSYSKILGAFDVETALSIYNSVQYTREHPTEAKGHIPWKGLGRLKKYPECSSPLKGSSGFQSVLKNVHDSPFPMGSYYPGCFRHGGSNIAAKAGTGKFCFPNCCFRKEAFERYRPDPKHNSVDYIEAGPKIRFSRSQLLNTAST